MCVDKFSICPEKIFTTSVVPRHCTCWADKVEVGKC